MITYSTGEFYLIMLFSFFCFDYKTHRHATPIQMYLFLILSGFFRNGWNNHLYCKIQYGNIWLNNKAQ